MSAVDDLKKLMAEAPEWQDRSDRVPVPLVNWGRDHFSTLLYVGSVAVDHHGRIDWDCIRVSARNWPMLFGARRRGLRYTGDRDAADAYPLRLRDHTDESANRHVGHCEADALMDMVDEGILTITMPKADRERNVYVQPNGHTACPVPVFPDTPTTGAVEWALMPWAKFGLTEAGFKLLGRLHEHRAAGKPVASFRPEAVTEEKEDCQ